MNSILVLFGILLIVNSTCIIFARPNNGTASLLTSTTNIFNSVMTSVS